MQLWQKKNNDIEINGLWSRTQAEARKILQPEYLCMHSFLPRQYLLAMSKEILHPEYDGMRLNEVTEKVFWHNVTGGHPDLQLLLEEHGYKKDATELVLFSHKISHLRGWGRFSAVYRINEQYVLKTVAGPHREKLHREFMLLSGMECEHIVKAFDFYESKYGAGMLLENLEPVSDDAKGYCNALEYLHSRGLCHGDIRYSNLGSLRDGCARLLDLGNAFYGAAEVMKSEAKNLRLLLEKLKQTDKKNG